MSGEENIFRALYLDYEDRCVKGFSPDTWRWIAGKYPPLLRTRPSTALKISEESGDMGLALLWIVQAALVNGLAHKINGIPGLNSFETSISIGALAHSESPERPVIISSNIGEVSLSGRKNFITGGNSADFIFLTCRQREEKKVSTLIYIPSGMIDLQKFTSLELGALHTVKHSSLELDGLSIPRDYIIKIPEGELRKSLKTSSLIERALILESFTGFALLLSGICGAAGLADYFSSTLERQSKILENAIDAFYNNSNINIAVTGMAEFRQKCEELKLSLEKKELTTADSLRLNDFRFMTNFLARFSAAS